MGIESTFVKLTVLETGINSIPKKQIRCEDKQYKLPYNYISERWKIMWMEEEIQTLSLFPPLFFFFVIPANIYLSTRSHNLETCKLESRLIIYFHFIEAITIIIMSLVSVDFSQI